MIESVNVDRLRGVFRVLLVVSSELPRKGCGMFPKTYSTVHHLQNLVLDRVEVLGVTSGSSADDVVNLDVVILAAHTAAVHCIGELDEYRVLLHDSLNVLTANTDDALVVLVWNVERDRRRHFLFHHAQASLHKLVVDGHNINVEVVLVEAIKDNLNVA